MKIEVKRASKAGVGFGSPLWARERRSSAGGYEARGFDGLDIDFTVDITVDDEWFVMEYPGLVRPEF